MLELNLIKDQLSVRGYVQDYMEEVHVKNKQDAQKAILLLEDEALSDEKLEAIYGLLNYPELLFVFDEDGNLRYSYGDVTVDQAFLCRLSQSRTETDDNNNAYAALPLTDDLFLAVGSSLVFTGQDFRNRDDDMDIIAEVSADMPGEIMVADLKSGKFIHAPAHMIEKEVSSFIHPVDHLFQEYMLMVDGHSIKLALTSRFEDYLLLSVSGLMDVFFGFNSAVIPALLGFGVLNVLLLAYVEFIRTDMSKGRIRRVHYIQLSKKRYLNTVFFRKLSGFALIGITCMVCIVYALQLLLFADEQRQQAEYRLGIAASAIEENQQMQDSANDFSEQVLLKYTVKDILDILEYKPELMDTEGLSALARLFNANSVFVLEENGQTIGAHAAYKTFPISSDPEDPTYPFWDVINGFSDSYTYRAEVGFRGQNEVITYTGIPIEDSRGMVVAGFSLQESMLGTEAFSIEDVFRRIIVDSQSLLLMVDADSGICIFDSSDQYTEQSIAAYGIKDTYLRNGYTGTHQFDQQEYLISVRTALDWILIYATPTDWLSANSWLFTVLVAVVSMLVILLSLLPHFLVGGPGEDLCIESVQAERQKPPRLHVDVAISQDGKLLLTENRTKRFSMHKRWSDKDSGSKLRAIIRMMLTLTASYLLILLLLEQNSGSNPLVNHIFERNWDKALNIYAISYIAIVLTGIWLFSGFLQKITQFVTSSFSRRWKTTGILFANMIRYAALIMSIFFTLQNIGVETSTLVTSASILTLIIGLGSQSLVADLIAGVFLIFEGTFRVGDIVTIDGWRGEVLEIGLRATKVKNSLGNVKVFQNSRISGAINMTSDQTYAVCDITLPQGVPLEAYEQKLVNNFFATAKDSVLGLNHPLVYEGVVAISAAGATLRISAKCREGEREQLQRQLYRALKIWQEQA